MRRTFLLHFEVYANVKTYWARGHFRVHWGWGKRIGGAKKKVILPSRTYHLKFRDCRLRGHVEGKKSGHVVLCNHGNARDYDTSMV